MIGSVLKSSHVTVFRGIERTGQSVELFQLMKGLDSFALVWFLEGLTDDVFARGKLVPLPLFDKATQERVHIHSLFT